MQVECQRGRGDKPPRQRLFNVYLLQIKKVKHIETPRRSQNTEAEKKYPIKNRYRGLRERLSKSQKHLIEQAKPYIWLSNQIEKKAEIEKVALSAPCMLEIGSGSGEMIIKLAKDNPSHNYLAVDLYRPGIAHILRAVQKYQLYNVGILLADAYQIIEMVPERSIKRLLICFPDPWPKTRHHKRRLISDQLMQHIMPILAQPCRILIMTDNASYATQVLELMRKQAHIINLAGKDQFSPPPVWCALSKYWLKAQQNNSTIFAMHFLYR